MVRSGVCLLAAFAVAAHANLTVDDSLNRYSMYGSRWITFEDRSSTANGGWIGSDSLVSFSARNTIRSVLTSGKDLMVRNGWDTVTGVVNLGRDLSSPDGTFYSAKFNSLVNVRGVVNLQWSNTFDGELAIGGGRLTMGQWLNGTNRNVFAGTPFTNNSANTLFTSPRAISGVRWNTVLPSPRTGYVLPDTNFNYGTIAITGGTAQGRTWRCGDEPASSGLGNLGCRDSVLPPGAYGDVVVPFGVTLYLGEGVYKFKSLAMQPSLANSPTRVLALQPNGARTVILLANGLSVGDNVPQSPAVIAPALYSKGYGTDANHFAGGTMMIVSHVDVKLSNWLDLWATLSVPDDKIEIYQSVRLFGQLFANRIVVHNDFKGTDGAFIPYYPSSPRITVANAGWIGTEGPSGFVQNAKFTLSMDHVNGLPVTVFYHTVVPTRDTTIAGVKFSPALDADQLPLTSDFQEVAGSVTIPATSLSTTLSIPVHGNDLYQPNRYFVLVLDSIRNGTLDSSGMWSGKVAVTARILDDDAVPALRVEDFAATEGTGPGTKTFRFRMSLVDPTSGAALPSSRAGGLQFNWSTIAASADSTDYTPVTGRFVRWEPGRTTDTLQVEVRSDSSFELDETFLVRISPVTGFAATGSRLSATGTILNDDPRPRLWIRDTSLRRDPSAWKTMKFVVSLLDSATGRNLTASGVATTVTWRTVAGTALADTDFTAASGTLVFAPGQTTDTIRIQVRGDARYHPPLTFSLSLSTPSTVSGSVSRFTATGTILSAVEHPVLVADTSRIPEGDAGRKAFVFTVVLRDSLTGKPVSSRVDIPFRWSTTGLTALVGTDFVLRNGSGRLPAGAAQVQIVADSILGNRIHQADRDLSLSLVPTGSGLAPSTAIGTILDDDPAPRVVIDDASAVRDTVAGSRRSLWFRVRLLDPSTGEPTTSGLPVVVHWKTLDSTAVAGLDYLAGQGRLSIPAGSRLDSLPVTILGDARFSPTNAFKVVLDTLSGATRGDTVGVGTLFGGARKPVLAIVGGTVLRPTEEGSSAPLPFEFHLVDPLTGAQTTSRARIGFSWSTFDSTALAGRDYVKVENAPAAVRAGAATDTFEVTALGFPTFAPPRHVGVHARFLDTTWISGDTLLTHTTGVILDSAANVGRFATRDTVLSEPAADSGDLVDVVVRLDAPMPDAAVHLPVVVDALRGTARLDVNFRLLDSVAVFAAGDTLDTLHIRLLHDGLYTGPLTIRLDLGGNARENVVAGDPKTLVFTVRDADPQPAISFVDTLLVVREADTTVSIVVRLDHPSAYAIAGNLGVVGGSAREGIDYRLGSGDFLFPPRALYDTVALEIGDNHRYGPDRDLVLKGARLADTAQATFSATFDQERVVILEADPRPLLAFAQDTLVVSDAEGGVDLPILLSDLSDSVALADLFLDTVRGTVDGIGLRPDSAYAVRIDTGSTRTTFRVAFANDGKVGPDRLVHLVLRDPRGATLGPDSVLVLVIRNTNVPPVVRILTPLDSSHTSNPDQRIEWTVDGTPQVPADTVLREGWNAITRCATDTAGNTGCDTHSVWGDFTPPVVHVFKIVGANPLDPSRDTTWWGDKARTRFGKDTIWYWSRDSILGADGNWHVDVDTFRTTTDFQGDGLFPTRVEVCDSVGNCGLDTGWIDLKQSLPVVEIVTPPQGAHLVVGVFPVSWTVTDGGLTWSEADNQVAAVPGELVVTRCHTDDVGNRGCATVQVVVEAIQVRDAKYVDLDGDGRVDAAVVELDARWTGADLPSFDFRFGDSLRTGNVPSSGSPFYAGASRGIAVVVGTDTLQVDVGASMTDSTGRLLRGSDGYPLTGVLGDTAFGADGKPLRDDSGRVYFVVAGNGEVDSTRFLVPIEPPFAFGMTGFDTLQPARMTTTWTVEDGLGVTKSVTEIDSFRVRDGAAPVVVAAEIRRVEKYASLDTLLVTLSEEVVLGAGGDWLQVGRCPGTASTCDARDVVWEDVPDSLVERLADGRYRFLVPNDSLSIRPGDQVRLRSDVADVRGNAIDTANLHWSTLVVGPARPPVVVMTPPSRIPVLPLSERQRTSPGGIVIRATKGSGGESTLSWWEPGRGYISGSDPSVTSICPDLAYCNGPKVYINRPVRIVAYIYDNAGTFVTKRTLDITADDIAKMEPDELDRISVEFDWNHRNSDGKLVSSGVYCWRIVTYVSQSDGKLPSISNQVFKVGVKIAQREGFF
jgi:hypothetical protein